MGTKNNKLDKNRKKENRFDIITKELFPLLKRLVKLILNIDKDKIYRKFAYT